MAWIEGEGGGEEDFSSGGHMCVEEGRNGERKMTRNVIYRLGEEGKGSKIELVFFLASTVVFSSIAVSSCIHACSSLFSHTWSLVPSLPPFPPSVRYYFHIPLPPPSFLSCDRLFSDLGGFGTAGKR